MTAQLSLVQDPDALITTFFQQSAGQWRSERRYYTLPDGETKEVVSLITVRFLPAASPELLHLADLHQLAADQALVCGTEISWDSQSVSSGKRESRGKTLFGVRGATLYRDRGFATPKPVTASFTFTDAQTLCLHTEYDGSVFDEEIKLVGQLYRTRQTIISRAGAEQMIGQYLEKRL